jgi:hypothetical protein
VSFPRLDYRAGLVCAGQKGVTNARKSISWLYRYRLKSNPGSSLVDPSFRLSTVTMALSSDYKRPEKGKEETASSEAGDMQKPADAKESIVIDGLRVDDLEFTGAGLLVRKQVVDNGVGDGEMGTPEDKEKIPEGEKHGWLILLDKFAWVEKVKVASIPVTT